METTIEVNSLRLFGYHGVFQQERSVGNDFIYTVHLTYPADPASDEISRTANYADIITEIRMINETPSSLIEHLAYRIQQALMSRWPEIRGGLVRVEKLLPPVAGVQLKSAAVVLRW